MKTAYVAIAEGTPNGRLGLKPVGDADSVAASAYPCTSGAKCPMLGYGHGNRVQPILLFDLSSIPTTAIIDSAILVLREAEGWDYDGEVALAPITSEVTFGELT